MQVDRRSVERPRISLSSISRETVRELVESEAAHLHRAVIGGRNPYQVRLDQHDQIVAFMGTLNPIDLEQFSTLYEQEAASARAAAARNADWHQAQASATVAAASYPGELFRVGPWALAIAALAAAMALLMLRR